MNEIVCEQNYKRCLYRQWLLIDLLILLFWYSIKNITPQYLTDLCFPLRKRRQKGTMTRYLGFGFEELY